MSKLASMISLWEKQSFLTSDIIIIGAGITGLSTAAALKESHPKLTITVLEKGILPSGASTKNAGFACFGSISELINDIADLGEEGMLSLVEKRVKGLEKTRKRLGDHRIDLQVKGGYELLFENTNIRDQIAPINQLLLPLFNDEVYQLSNEKINTFGFHSVNAIVENKFEGQLDTGKLMASLWDYCSHLGIKVFTGLEVLSIEETDSTIRVVGEQITFESQQLGICTNAFIKDLLPEALDVTPGRGMVMSILPKDTLKISGTFHYDEGYYYFRDYYGKLIFGGGRNLDKETEATHQHGINEQIRQKLMEDLKTIILPDQDFEVEQVWSGIMAFGQTKSPIIRRVTDRIAIGVRLGGMGVAIGSLVGDQVANLLSD